MPTPPTQEQNLLFQSYFTFCLLPELKINGFLESDYYNDMVFSSPWIKEEIRKIDLDNQGCAMIALYTMLVLPRQILLDAYPTHFEDLNNFLNTHTKNTENNYKYHKKHNKPHQYIRHVRNAVSHARVEFRPSDVVVFKDENTNDQNQVIEVFSTELPLTYLGEFLQKLQNIYITYIDDLKKQSVPPN